MLCVALIEQINLTIIMLLSVTKEKVNKIWVQPELRPPKPDGYWEAVASKLSDQRFQKKYRVNKRTFNYICNVVRKNLKRIDTKMRSAICVEKRVIIAIHILKSNCDLSTVADPFKVGKSSVGQIINRVLRFSYRAPLREGNTISIYGK